ncbi:MAG: response regulator [Myxococcales bacterium]
MEPDKTAAPKVLIAEDGKATAMLLETLVSQWGFQATVVHDGLDAVDVLRQAGGPRLAILDWEMPGLDGPDVCRTARRHLSDYVYLILLTARTDPSATVVGLEAGADDFISKPFDENELRCRLRTGRRIVDLQTGLAQKVKALQDALNQVDELEGMIPICMHCKRVRDTNQLWLQVERYIEKNSAARFSHGICDKCMAERYPEATAVPAEPRKR